MNTETKNAIGKDDNSILKAQQEKIAELLKDLKPMDLERRIEKILKIVASEHLNVIKGVLEQGGAGIHIRGSEIRDFSDRTMLHEALERGDYDIVEYMINVQKLGCVLSEKVFRVAINDFISDIHTIKTASYENKCKILELLFSKQSHLIEAKGSYKSAMTPLHYATWQKFSNGKQLEFIQFLLKHKADVNAQAQFCETPLHFAAKGYVPKNVIEIIRVLITHGADTDAINSEGYKFWHIYANDAPPDLYQEILKYLVSIRRITQEDMQMMLEK